MSNRENKITAFSNTPSLFFDSSGHALEYRQTLPHACSHHQIKHSFKIFSLAYFCSNWCSTLDTIKHFDLSNLAAIDYLALSCKESKNVSTHWKIGRGGGEGKILSMFSFPPKGVGGCSKFSFSVVFFLFSAFVLFSVFTFCFFFLCFFSFLFSVFCVPRLLMAAPS